MKTRTDIQNMVKNNNKIVMISAYDFPSAQQSEAAGADIILVGDSLGMVVLGYHSTVQVTVSDMIHHAKAVKRGAKNTFVAVDMPFMSYHLSLEKSLENAQKIFQETNAQALKVEGYSEQVLQLTKRLTVAGIPVINHLGLTPQTFNVLGGYPVQGRGESGIKLLQHAKELERAGSMAIVLEAIPKQLAQKVTQNLSIPTIGIGAGIHCDGQALVYHDILRYGKHHLPSFAKAYSNFQEVGVNGLTKFVIDVKTNQFPTDEQSFF